MEAAGERISGKLYYAIIEPGCFLEVKLLLFFGKKREI